MLTPDAVHGGVGHIVVPGHEEESHLHLIDEAEEFFPLALDLVDILGIALDQVADGDDELRPEQVDVADPMHPHAGTMAASAVGHHDKVEAVLGVEHRLCGPRPRVALDCRQLQRAVRDVMVTVGRVADCRSCRQKRYQGGQQRNAVRSTICHGWAFLKSSRRAETFHGLSCKPQ
jgi:hypothetical protein